MCGEAADSSGLLVERFATLHRQNYGGCKGGVSDVIIGASALAAQYQGTLDASTQRQTRRDATPGRDRLCGFCRLLGPGIQNQQRSLLSRPASRQLHEA